jgi:hypothetical protein
MDQHFEIHYCTCGQSFTNPSNLKRHQKWCSNKNQGDAAAIAAAQATLGGRPAKRQKKLDGYRQASVINNPSNNRVSNCYLYFLLIFLGLMSWYRFLALQMMVYLCQSALDLQR